MDKKKKIKNELEYFWMYYKWQALAVLVILVIGIYFLCTVLSQKEKILSVMLIDCHASVSQEQMEKDYMKAEGLDEGRYQAEILGNLMFEDAGSENYAMTSLSRFLADIGSEKLDVCAMLEESFLKYDNSGTYMDLRECLTGEELEELGQQLLTMEDGRVIGVYTDDLPVMKDYGCYQSGNSRGVVGIVYNTLRKDAAVSYLRYISGMK